jgi:RHS repeat-associated protein
MQMPGRKLSGGYRYGFNDKENDNEVKGEGNQQDYGMRIYDGRIGKFLSVDPLTKNYPWYTPYQFAGNSPIKFIDLDGLEPALPKVIGTTYPKLKRLKSAEIEKNLASLNVQGLSITYLKALIKEEGLSLFIYDVDTKVEKIKTASGRGGDATIGFGHLIHYGAIGSTQYDKDALTKEQAYKDGQIKVSEAFSMLSVDLSERMSHLNNSLKKHKINNASQGVIDLFMDLIYNTGNANQAIKIYKKGGVLGLYMGLQNNSSDKTQNLKSVSEARKNMRLELITEDLQKENIDKATEDPLKAKPEQEAENASMALIRLSTGEYILKITIGKKCFIILNS